MKVLKLFTLVFAGAFAFFTAASQNVSINIQTQNSGIVKIGESIFLEVWINNSDADNSVPVYKLRPQISIPSKIVSIASKGHKLPEGWSIISNSKGVLRLSNGSDIIGPSDARIIFIALTGTAEGGPLTIAGSMNFSTGASPGIAAGPATASDNPADNSSTTTCKTIK